MPLKPAISRNKSLTWENFPIQRASFRWSIAEVYSRPPLSSHDNLITSPPPPDPGIPPPAPPWLTGFLHTVPLAEREARVVHSRCPVCTPEAAGRAEQTPPSRMAGRSAGSLHAPPAARPHDGPPVCVCVCVWAAGGGAQQQPREERPRRTAAPRGRSQTAGRLQECRRIGGSAGGMHLPLGEQMARSFPVPDPRLLVVARRFVRWTGNGSNSFKNCVACS